MTSDGDGLPQPGCPTAGQRPATAAPAAASQRPATRATRSSTRPSTPAPCTRCARRWPRTRPRPAWRRAGPTTWSSPCTNWPPTRCGTAPGTGGSGSGGRPGAALRDRRRRRPAAGTGGKKAPDAAQWRTEPGHGLSLVRQVADQASLRSGPSGTLATISFALGPPGPPFRLDQPAPGRLHRPGRHRPARPRFGRSAQPGDRAPARRRPPGLSWSWSWTAWRAGTPPAWPP